jgi:hypothetical protein
MDLFGENYDYMSSAEDLQKQVEEPADFARFIDSENIKILSFNMQKK